MGIFWDGQQFAQCNFVHPVKLYLLRMSSAATTSASLVPQKRKAPHESAANADCPPARRKESEAGSSQASEDTTTMALRTILDGASSASSKNTYSSKIPSKKLKASFDVNVIGSISLSGGPLVKRKMSTDSASFFIPRLTSTGSIDDAALGLIPLGSNGSLPSIEQKLPDVNGRILTTSSALEHLDALGDDAASIGAIRDNFRDEDDSHASSVVSGGKILVEALIMGSNSVNRQRDRFESWGGMSDISLAMGSDSIQQSKNPPDSTSQNRKSSDSTPLDSTQLDKTPLDSDQSKKSLCKEVAAASASLTIQNKIEIGTIKLEEPIGSDASDTDNPVPSKISLPRERKYSVASISVASLGEASLTNHPEAAECVSTDIQAFVAAAMATVGDQLAELAGVVETVVGTAASMNSDGMKDMKDDHSITSNGSSLPEIQVKRERSLSMSSNPSIAVDYDAVAAAVDAAEAATGSLNLTHIGKMAPPSPNRSDKKTRSSLPSDLDNSSLLPHISPIPHLTTSGKSERDMEAIRARARAAAGYIPPANLKPGEVPPPQPVRKRPKPSPSYKGMTQSFSPDHVYGIYHSTNKASSQKWDEMYECLLSFVEDRRRIETKGTPEHEKKNWEWDGNVPTTYKTKDGKALGRWINNQRSAKHKGNLKRDREVKLVSTGLKWSVLSTNSWQDMMEELKLYVRDKTKDGQEWDGNVPTNYKIKGNPEDDNDGEEKNLGRWINRQRSLYQAGKLRKDREMELEKIGLKWSVLSTTSWQSMYETLLQYIEDRRKNDGGWDGNVPANYKTNDVPQKALGRWINRQRTAHQKSKLKKEFVDKLNAVGLKWSVHERRSVTLHTLPTPIKSNITSGPTPVKSNLTVTRTSIGSSNGNCKKADSVITKTKTGSVVSKPTVTPSTRHIFKATPTQSVAPLTTVISRQNLAPSTMPNSKVMSRQNLTHSFTPNSEDSSKQNKNSSSVANSEIASKQNSAPPTTSKRKKTDPVTTNSKVASRPSSVVISTNLKEFTKELQSIPVASIKKSVEPDSYVTPEAIKSSVVCAALRRAESTTTTITIKTDPPPSPSEIPCPERIKSESKLSSISADNSTTVKS